MNALKPTFYMTVGLPASGKSTWAEINKDKLTAVLHSSDAIREELGNINDQSNNAEVFELLHRRAKEDLRAGKNVIYDATNLNRKRRVAFLNELKSISCNKVCVLFATPYELCVARNFTRDRQVPEEVLSRMYRSFNTPTKYEGFDSVQIIYADYSHLLGFEFNFKTSMRKWRKIDHDNPHHSLTIGAHMLKAASYMRDKTQDTKLFASAVLHDCGKNACKSFYDSKGNLTSIAHYYNHEHVSAYLSLFYLINMYPTWTDEDILYVSLLIDLHMKPYLAYKQSDKSMLKDRQLFGDKFIDEVFILHECDEAAHQF